jgi:translation elongation factor EF-G
MNQSFYHLHACITCMFMRCTIRVVQMVGNVIPPEYYSAIEKGFKEAANSGALLGAPVEVRGPRRDDASAAPHTARPLYTQAPSMLSSQCFEMAAISRHFMLVKQARVLSATRALFCERLALCVQDAQGVRVVLTDGAAHAVDSSELAFRIAAINAFRQVCLAPLALAGS